MKWNKIKSKLQRDFIRSVLHLFLCYLLFSWGSLNRSHKKTTQQQQQKRETIVVLVACFSFKYINILYIFFTTTMIHIMFYFIVFLSLSLFLFISLLLIKCFGKFCFIHSRKLVVFVSLWPSGLGFITFPKQIQRVQGNRSLFNGIRNLHFYYSLSKDNCLEKTQGAWIFYEWDCQLSECNLKWL